MKIYKRRFFAVCSLIVALSVLLVDTTFAEKSKENKNSMAANDVVNAENPKVSNIQVAKKVNLAQNTQSNKSSVLKESGNSENKGIKPMDTHESALAKILQISTVSSSNKVLLAQATPVCVAPQPDAVVIMP